MNNSVVIILVTIILMIIAIFLWVLFATRQLPIIYPLTGNILQVVWYLYIK